MKQFQEVAPPGFGHTKSDKEKGVEKGGTAAAFNRARKEGRFKGSKSDMFAIMWSQKKKGDKPHYKPGTDKKYKKYQDEDWKPEIEHSKLGDAVKKKREKKRKEAESSLPPHLRLDAMRKAFAHTNESAVLDANTKISKDEKKKKKEAELRRLLQHAIAVKKGQAESFEIDKSAHKTVQKKAKMRNLAIKNTNKNEGDVAHRKAGGPKLMGESHSCPEGQYYCYDNEKCMPIPDGMKVGKDGMLVKEGAAWTKKAGKKESGGLNEKGRKSYERENPGSDLKAPSKKVGNKRRSSFCARMKGMKKKLTSAKTANDPDSRINKSLRAWNCEYEPDGTTISEKNKSGDSSLHDWFNKSKSSDGKPGWVQAGGKFAGKPCAKQPGQVTKPKCISSKMKRNMSKDEEEAAHNRKQRQDPNPERSGKAKNVATECWKGYKKKGMKKKGNRIVPNCVPEEKEMELKEYSPNVTYQAKGGKKSGKLGKSSVYSLRDKDESKKEFRKSQIKDIKGGYLKTEENLPVNEGKGEKDACYHKVKSRFKIWPSAYASGALVKCRKKGADNWGNSTKKEELTFEGWQDRAKEAMKKVVGKKKEERKASMDSTTSKLHDLRKEKFKSEKQKEHEKYVNFLDADD